MYQKRVQFNKFEYVPTPKTLKWISKALEYKFNIAERNHKIWKGYDGLSGIHRENTGI